MKNLTAQEQKVITRVERYANGEDPNPPTREEALELERIAGTGIDAEDIDLIVGLHKVIRGKRADPAKYAELKRALNVE